MRNILNVFRNDCRILTSSVVTIVMIIGLCLLPCLYAWFNIFSNWDPYVGEATGRIAVAVVNEDEGTELLGLNINVGEKITEELKANRDIGWTFVSSGDKALDGLYAGDYYAAVIIPESFSSDVLSFTSGDLVHPELDYYENEKKNAIAPKITAKAEAALQEEVDAAFIDAVGTYVSEAAEIANAAGLDPEDVFGDLSERLDLLGDRMDDLVAVVAAAQGLTDAANKLLKATDALTGSTQDAIRTGEKILDEEEAGLPEIDEDAKKVSDSVRKDALAIAGGLDLLYDALSKVADDMDAFNDFVVNDLDEHKILVKDMADSAADVADKLARLGLSGLSGRFRALSQKLMDIYYVLDDLEQADETTWPRIQKLVKDLMADIKDASDTARSIAEDVGTQIDNKIDQAISDAGKAIRELRSSLEESYGDLDTLSSALAGSEKTLSSLHGDLKVSISDLIDMQTGLRSLSELFESLSDSDLLSNVNYLISDGTDVIAEHLASPISMDKEVIYPIRNFGSAMAPFFTVLALWVGALFTSVLIRARVRPREGEAPLRLREQFFGRYRLFFMVGMIQALILSLGDLLYCGIQCEHPVLFVIAMCVIGMVFMMINFALTFVFDTVGAGLSVIIVLLQVAGSGGTFPPEVLPRIFQLLYPFMPFRYAMNALRECIAGIYGTTYITCLGILLIFGAVAAVLGLLLVRPASLITDKINEAFEASDLME